MVTITICRYHLVWVESYDWWHWVFAGEQWSVGGKEKTRYCCPSDVGKLLDLISLSTVLFLFHCCYLGSYYLCQLRYMKLTFMYR